MNGICPDCGGTRGRQSPRCRPCHLTQRWGPTDPDPVTIDRLCHGQRTASTVAERKAAICHLTEHGYSARLIAEKVGVTERTVVRMRQQARPVSTVYS